MTDGFKPREECVEKPTTAGHLSAGAEDFDPWNRTRSVARIRERDQFWSNAGDVYMLALGALFILLLAIGIFRAFSDEFRNDVGNAGLVESAYGVVPADVALSAGLAVMLMTGLQLAAKFGPIAVDRAQGLWWLSLPVQRNPILARILRRRLAWSMLAGVLLFVPIGLAPIGAVGGSGWGLVLGCAATGLLLVDVVLVAAGFQIMAQSATLRRILPTALSVVGVLFAIEVVLRFTGSQSGLTPIWSALPSRWPILAQHGNVDVVVILAVAALTGYWWIHGQLERISTSDLMASGAVSGHTGAALFFLNAGELAAALGQGHSPLLRTSSRGTRLLPARLQRGPVTALMRAQALVTVRHSGVFGRLLAGWCIPAAVAVTAGGNSPIVLLAAVVLGSCFAGTTAAVAARQSVRLQSAGFPVPLGRDAARRVHSLVPMLLLIPWGSGLAGVLWLLGGSGPELLVLGALGGIALGAGGVRRAFQPAMNWESTMVLATAGRASAPIIGNFVHGYDVMIFGLVPLGVGLFMSAIPTAALAVAAAVAVVCWLVGTTSAAEPKRYS